MLPQWEHESGETGEEAEDLETQMTQMVTDVTESSEGIPRSGIPTSEGPVRVGFNHKNGISRLR